MWPCLGELRFSFEGEKEDKQKIGRVHVFSCIFLFLCYSVVVIIHFWFLEAGL